MAMTAIHYQEYWCNILRRKTAAGRDSLCTGTPLSDLVMTAHVFWYGWRRSCTLEEATVHLHPRP